MNLLSMFLKYCHPKVELAATAVPRAMGMPPTITDEGSTPLKFVDSLNEEEFRNVNTQIKCVAGEIFLMVLEIVLLEPYFHLDGKTVRN